MQIARVGFMSRLRCWSCPLDFSDPDTTHVHCSRCAVKIFRGEEAWKTSTQRFFCKTCGVLIQN